MKQMKQKRVSTGSHAIDTLLGGGFPLGTVTILASQAGAGKTTLGMQWAIHSPTPAILLSIEQPEPQLHALGRRLGVTANASYFKEIATLEDVERVMENGTYSLVVVDTMNSFNVQPWKVADSVSWHARKYSLAVVLLAHLNSDGELSGGPRAEHLVDAVMTLNYNYNSGERELFFAGKSRYCRTDAPTVVLKMTENGLLIPEAIETRTQH